jgi:hypothetical protein
MSHPLARSEGLVVRRLAGEVVISDTKNGKVHCLNAASAWVWDHCDGKTPVAGLAAGLEEALGLPRSEDLARLALDQLERRGLLERSAPKAQARSRREALKALAIAASALPLVMTLTSTKARAGISSFFGECAKFTGGVYSTINEGMPCGNGTGTCRDGFCVPNPPPAANGGGGGGGNGGVAS